MARLLSDRARNTDQVVLLPSSLEDPNISPPGLYRVGLLTTCISISAFFISLVIAYYWRKHTPPFWDPVPIPKTLRLSTVLILISSGTFETARQLFRRGRWRLASQFLLVTASLGTAFLASQLTAWRSLVQHGAFLAKNPHSSFFFLFTGLHAAHLVGGLVVLFVVVLGKSKRRELVDVATYYWHFLGVLWLWLYWILVTA
jgi:cytochrome c oxidase subunit III